VIANWFRFRKGSFDAPQQRLDFHARVTNRETNAEWRVQFAPLISAGYYIIDLDPNYKWAVVGHPSRRYGWILARSKTLPDRIYQACWGGLQHRGTIQRRLSKYRRSGWAGSRLDTDHRA
jgi:apolipoprotein D and lipocalin family protein